MQLTKTQQETLKMTISSYLILAKTTKSRQYLERAKSAIKWLKRAIEEDTDKTYIMEDIKEAA